MFSAINQIPRLMSRLHARNTSHSTCTNESSNVSNVIAFACECSRSSQLHSHWVDVVTFFVFNTYLIRIEKTPNMSEVGVFQQNVVFTGTPRQQIQSREQRSQRIATTRHQQCSYMHQHCKIMHATSNTAAISNKRAEEFWLIAIMHNITR